MQLEYSKGIQLPRGFSTHVLGIGDHPVSATLLGLVHGCIGAINQSTEPFAGPARGHTEAGGHLRPARKPVTVKRSADPFRNTLGSGRPGVGQQKQKLLASPAAKKVHRAEATARHVAENAQHLVAGSVAVGVVDSLEVVKIDHHQRQLVAMTS